MTNTPSIKYAMQIQKVSDVKKLNYNAYPFRPKPQQMDIFK